MMKKTGFTLGEVLLSLGIVGVLAAVVLPSLMLNVERSKVGPALMKAVNTLEVANSLALQMSGARKLSGVVDNAADAGKYFDMILADYSKLSSVPYSGASGLGSAYATKDGIVFLHNGNAPTSGGTVSKKFIGNYYVVYVDTNGSRHPNKEGRDIFKLYVDDKGMVIPHGSNLAKEYGTSTTTWETGCKSVVNGVKTTPSDATTCAGSIVDNGGRVLYAYDSITGSGVGTGSGSES